MPSHPVFFDLTDTADERFDPAVESLLAGLVVFSPLALGAVQPWSETIVVAMAAAMMLLLLIKLLVRPDVRFAWNRTYWPIIGFLALVLLQLVPLPGWLARLISPQTFSIRNEVLQATYGPATSAGWMRLSLYPEATVGHLRLLLVACAVYVVAINIVRRLRQVKRMLAVIAMVGGVVAILALAQNITDARSIYWLVPIEGNEAISGPFVNHSHFAQFMNLSIGAATALLLLHLDQLPRHRHHRTHRGAALARPVTGPIGLLACATVLMAVGVFLCKSRGGMAAMLVAGVFSTFVLASRRGMRGRTWIFVGIALAVFASMLMLRWDEVFQRVTSASDPHSLGGRIDIARGTGRMWTHFPVFGAGLGSFEMTFGVFDPSSIAKIAEHADNEYAQVLAETGTIGLLLALAFIVMIWRAYARCVRSAPSPMASAAIGLGFGFCAILVHSTTDFGQHIPANFTLTAITCALMVNLAQATTHRHAAAGEVAPRAARWPRAAGLGLAGLAAVWLIFDAANVWRADRSRAAAARVERGFVARQWRGSPEQFARLIDFTESAARIRPGNAVYRFDLNYFRWKGLLWLREQGEAYSDAVQRDTRRLVDELLAISRICPTYSQPPLLAGQLRKYVLHEPGGAELIRLARRLSPNNPGACVAVAVLDAEQGRWDESLAAMRRAIELQRDFLDDAIDALLDRLHRPDLALQLANDDLESLRHLMRRLEKRGDATGLVSKAQARAEQLVLERAEKPGATPGMLAEAAYLCLRRNDHQAAADLLRRALATEYAQAQWRVDLARALLSLGQTEQALDQARTVLRISPANTAAARLIEEHESVPQTEEKPANPPTTIPSTMPSHGFRFD